MRTKIIFDVAKILNIFHLGGKINVKKLFQCFLGDNLSPLKNNPRIPHAAIIQLLFMQLAGN